MTVTIVFAGSGDGYLSSTNANYTTARNGSGLILTAGGNNGYYGQSLIGGNYGNHQTFIGFAFSAIAATEIVTSAQIRVTQAVQLNSGTTRDMEMRGIAWGTLATADWQNIAGLTADQLFASVQGVTSSVNKRTFGGSDLLVTTLASVTSMEVVVVSSRQRAGNTPTVDEGSAIWLSELSGTADDPMLVFTTATRSRITQAFGACVTLSDGTWAYLESDGSATPTVTLKHVTQAGTVTSIVALPNGTAVTDFDITNTPGAQALSMAIDASDNIYIVGKLGNATNSLGVKAYLKGGGYAWTGQTMRVIPLPTYNSRVNNVTVTFNATGDTLVILAAHTTGPGIAGGAGNDTAYAIVSATTARTGTGTLICATGAVLGTMQPASLGSSAFNGFANEVGSGLDVVADSANTDRGFMISFGKDALPGDNFSLSLGRYILDGSGNSFTHTSYKSGVTWGKKDGNGKLRVIPCGSGQVAIVSADADASYGLSVEVYQAYGTTAGATYLGGEALADESIVSMPDGPAIGGTNFWDAVYNSAENSIWVYYRHVSDVTKLMRTSVDLNTYSATRVEVTVLDIVSATANIIGVRVPRAKAVTQKGLVQVAVLDAGVLTLTNVIDTFNLAPTAPTLTAKANFDATAAATFTWTFNDPNSGDTQSAYQLRIYDQSDDSLDYDSGKVTSATASKVLTAATLTNSKSYRWQVRTYDALDVVSPYSDFGTFSTSAGGTVTVTAPATDNMAGINTDDYVVQWSVAGTVQASYRVILTRGAVTVSDTGFVTSVATSATIAGMTTNVEHIVSVQVKNAAAVASGIGTRKITPDYGTPDKPTVIVDPDLTNGYSLITVTNPTPTGDRPAVASNVVLRRKAGSTDLYDVIGAVAPGVTFRDYAAASGVTYEYIVRGDSA